MKKFFAILCALALSHTAFGQYFINAYSTTGGTPLTVSSNNLIIDTITVTAATANLTTAKFYDSASGTNYVAPAYTYKIGYPTNITQVFTNESNIYITNTYKGWYTGTATTSASTNEIPPVATFAIPGSTQVSRNVRIGTIQGLTLLTDQNAVITLQYRLAQ